MALTARKNNNMALQKGLLTVFLWIFIFNPPLIPWFNVAHVLGAIACFYILFQGKVKTKFFYYELAFLVIFVYIILHVLFNKRVGIFAYPIYFIFDVVPVCYMLCLVFRRMQLTVREVESLIISAAMIGTIISLLCLCSSSIYSFFFNYSLKYTGREEYYTSLSNRIYGFYSNSLFSAPVAQAIIAVLDLRIFLYEKKFRYVVCALLQVAMAFINARTALFVFLAGVAVLAVLEYKRVVTFLKIFAVLLVAFIATYFWLRWYMKNHLDNYNEMIYRLYDAFAIILNFLGIDQTVYFDVTSYFKSNAKWQFPTTFVKLIFGSGEHIMTSNSNGVYSDIGFVNDVWYGGLVYSASIYTCVFVMLRKIKNCLYGGKDEAYGTFLFWMWAVALVLSNVKSIAVDFNCIMCLFFLFFSFSVFGEGLKVNADR